MTAPADLDAVRAMLEGVTPGPWWANGEPWNQTIWSSAENRVCFMAHSNGADDARDLATARFIAAARDLVPALAAAKARVGKLREALVDILDGIGFMCGGDHELEGYGISEDRGREIRQLIKETEDDA